MNIDKSNNPLESQEVFDIVWDLNTKDAPTNTRAYVYVAEHACKAMCEKGDIPSWKKMLELCEDGKMFADIYLKKMVVPNGNKEEFMEAFTLLGRYENSSTGAIKKKLSECKDIIQANYSDDAKLMDHRASANCARQQTGTIQ